MSSITSKQSRLKIRLTESQFMRLLTIFFACFLTMKNFALEKSGLFFFLNQTWAGDNLEYYILLPIGFFIAYKSKRNRVSI